MSLFNYYPNGNKTDPKKEKQIAKHSFLFSAFFLFCFWIVLVIDQLFNLHFYKAGLFPLSLKGVPGIFLAPFIHGGYNHLLANSLPFLVLTFALIYFYRGLGYRIFFQLYFISDLLVWLCARPAWHIGSSGLIYGMASFLFFSGIFRNDLRLLTIALIIVFLYGSLFWGLFPFNPETSWESHLMGAISGFVLSIFYRKSGPQRIHYDWEEDEEGDNDDENSNESFEKTLENEASNGINTPLINCK